MRTTGKFTVLVCATLCIIACDAIDVEVNKKAPVDAAAEAETLMALSRQWSEDVGAGRLEAALAYWADDAVMLPPDLPFLEGKDAIREFVMGTGDIPGFSISWEPISATIAAAGDMAYLIERNRIEFDGEDGERVVIPGKVVTIWRKDADGNWKNVVDMWNAAPAE